MFLPVSYLHFNPQAIYFILGVILLCGGGILREKGTEELNSTYVVAPKTERKGTEELNSTYVVAPKTERKGTEEGGFFVPMATLIIGFNQKSSTAMSKPLIFFLEGLFRVFVRIRYDCGRSNFYYNFNVIFADWMITLLIIAVHFDDILLNMILFYTLIIYYLLFLIHPTYSFFKGFIIYNLDLIKNKDIGLLTVVLVALLTLQVAKHYTRTCSILYWLLNFLQVSSATAIFVMAFSSSMSIVEYYLIKRFPVPYALYFVVVATISAVVGQYVVGKVIKIIGRASLIMFLLPSMIFISVISLAHAIDKIQHKEYMRFENICKYQFKANLR
ncbi:hypothetical protein UlMin_018137 [Ulmus minor]